MLCREVSLPEVSRGSEEVPFHSVLGEVFAISVVYFALDNSDCHRQGGCECIVLPFQILLEAFIEGT